MRQISSRPDMNSRAARWRSHKGRIRSRAVSGWNSVIEDADQGERRSIGDRFIPVVENSAEWRFALEGADDGADEDGHPQQRAEASAEAEAAKRRENDQNAHSQAKANEYLGRAEFSR